MKYDVCVSLLGVEPAVWRRVRVPGDVPLSMVHLVFQMAMGWQNCHAHEFVADSADGRRIYGEGDDSGGFFGARVLDEKKYRFADLLKEVGDRCVYSYDFGDNWQHEVVLEAVVSDEVDVPDDVLRCLDGSGACPPEDCGGVPGYCELLESFRDSGHPEHDDVVAWLGEGFQPEAFDCQAHNGLFALTFSEACSERPREEVIDIDDNEDDILMELEEFLASGAVSENGMTLMMLDGFLASLAVLPVTLMPVSWMHLVWDMSGEGVAPEFSSDEEADRINAILVSYMIGVANQFDEEPEKYLPLYEEIVFESDQQRFSVGREWAYGFMAGVMIDDRVWDLTRHDADGGEFLDRILALSGIAEAEVEVDVLEMIEVMDDMALTLQALKEFWSPWRRKLEEQKRAGSTVRKTEDIGRNDPCPCGSGKKYKKCCGK